MSLDPRRLFLIDGVGALATAALLVTVLAQFEPTFGMPSRVIYVLAAVAIVFAVYSLTCYLIRPSGWPLFLLIIAVANLSYCVVTMVLMFLYRHQITIFGAAYFLGEVVIISVLAAHEIVNARRAAHR